jgi:hypothetical protein
MIMISWQHGYPMRSHFIECSTFKFKEINYKEFYTDSLKEHTKDKNKAEIFEYHINIFYK